MSRPADSMSEQRRQTTLRFATRHQAAMAKKAVQTRAHLLLLDLHALVAPRQNHAARRRALARPLSPCRLCRGCRLGPGGEIDWGWFRRLSANRSAQAASAGSAGWGGWARLAATPSTSLSCRCSNNLSSQAEQPIRPVHASSAYPVLACRAAAARERCAAARPRGWRRRRGRLAGRGGSGCSPQSQTAKD